jgi:hypothetical protein
MAIDFNIDEDFIFGVEGSTPYGIVPKTEGGTADKSGVTIGKGIDLGGKTPEGLRRSGVPEALIDKLRPYLGLKGPEARSRIRELAGPQTRNLVLNKTELGILDNAVKKSLLQEMEEFYDKRAVQQGSSLRFKDLPRALQTAVYSVGYNIGPKKTMGYGKKGEDLLVQKKSEYVNWPKQVVQGDWGAAAKNLLGSWHNPNRRKRESNLIKTWQVKLLKERHQRNINVAKAWKAYQVHKGLLK